MRFRAMRSLKAEKTHALCLLGRKRAFMHFQAENITVFCCLDHVSCSCEFQAKKRVFGGFECPKRTLVRTLECSCVIVRYMRFRPENTQLVIFVCRQPKVCFRAFYAQKPQNSILQPKDARERVSGTRTHRKRVFMRCDLEKQRNYMLCAF